MERKFKIEKKGLRGITAFITGFWSPFKAITFVRQNKGLKRYFIIPFLLNLFILSFLLYLTTFYLYPYVQEILPVGDAWYFDILHWIATPLIFVISAVAAILGYSILGNILAAPFLDPLSIAVEKRTVEGAELDGLSLKEMIIDFKRVFQNLIKLFLFLVIFNLLIFALNFIPVVGNFFYALFGYLSLVFFFAFQFFDFILERRYFTFKEKMKILWSFKMVVFGTGTSFFCISLIPVVGFLAIPLGTIAGSRIYLEEMEKRVEVIEGHK